MDRIRLLKKPNKPVSLPRQGALPPDVHDFEQQSIDAINAALAARRPLLIRGEPGVGKSQLARAAAHQLKRALITFVVDSRTEFSDWPTLKSVVRFTRISMKPNSDSPKKNIFGPAHYGGPLTGTVRRNGPSIRGSHMSDRKNGNRWTEPCF